MSEQIEALKKYVALGAEIGNVAEDLLAGEGDLVKKGQAVFQLADEVIALQGIKDHGKAFKRFKHLTADERRALIDHLKEHFDLNDNHLELIIEESLELVHYALGIGPRAKNIISLVKDAKKAKKPEAKKPAKGKAA